MVLPLRAKNALSILTQVLVGIILMQLMWYLFGYSLVFSNDYAGLIGDVRNAIYLNMDACFNVQGSHAIPELAYATFQSMFAAITPLLMTGSFAERLKMKPFIVLIIIWELIVYYPVAHWIWGGGWLGKLGVIDFAGGIVIHATAGSSALVIVLMMGRRIDFHMHHGEPHPHNVPLASIGAALLWMGWYGFNAGSALQAGAVAANTVTVTTIGAVTAGFVWVLASLIQHRAVHTVAVINGVIAGLAGITPISGYIYPYWALPVGAAIGISSYVSVLLLKVLLKIDDALDVSSVHGVPGIVGAFMIGIFASKDVNPAGQDGAIYGNPMQIAIQLLGITVASAWAVFWTFFIVLVLKYNRLPGWRMKPRPNQEIIGLDAMEHGHGAVAYHNLFYELDPMWIATQEAEAKGQNVSEGQGLLYEDASVTRGDFNAMHPTATIDAAVGIINSDY
jgi:Amt family ammonium transporter